MKRTASVFTDNMHECFACGSYDAVEVHHIFGGSNRKHSDEYGYVLPLCRRCHNEPPVGVHYNKEKRREYQRMAQKHFEVDHTREEFRLIFGKSYLD